MGQPFEVWCAIICGSVQYIARKLPRLMRTGSVIRAERSQTSS